METFISEKDIMTAIKLYKMKNKKDTDMFKHQVSIVNKKKKPTLPAKPEQSRD